VDPIRDPLILRKSGSAGIELGTSGSVSRNSDKYTTEVVKLLCLSPNNKVTPNKSNTVY
jgi:hypothetical protein